MADRTGIEWTDSTWNPIVGCSVVSPGCTNCYAMKMAARIEAMQPGSHYAGTTHASKAGAVWTGKLALAPDSILTKPLRWHRPRKIFVNSMGDLFHESVPDAWIDRVFAVMALTPQHTYQVLTKRSARMRAYMAGHESKIPYLGRMPLERVHLEAAAHMEGDGGYMDALKRAGNIYSLYLDAPWPLPNVWLGVSTEDQRRAAERVPDLLATPAAIRFVSAEPLLGPIRFDRIRVTPDHHTMIDALRGYALEGGGRTRLHQIIAGGESGPNARPAHPDWVRSFRAQCAVAGAAFFFKQWGEWHPRRPAYAKDLFAARQSVIVSPNGATTSGLMAYPADAWVMDRIGKSAAGRLLDGVEHNAMPEVRP